MAERVYNKRFFEFRSTELREEMRLRYPIRCNWTNQALAEYINKGIITNLDEIVWESFAQDLSSITCKDQVYYVEGGQKLNEFAEFIINYKTRLRVLLYLRNNAETKIFTSFERKQVYAFEMACDKLIKDIEMQYGLSIDSVSAEPQASAIKATCTQEVDQERALALTKKEAENAILSKRLSDALREIEGLSRENNRLKDELRKTMAGSMVKAPQESRLSVASICDYAKVFEKQEHRMLISAMLSELCEDATDEEKALIKDLKKSSKGAPMNVKIETNYGVVNAIEK